MLDGSNHVKNVWPELLEYTDVPGKYVMWFDREK